MTDDRPSDPHGDLDPSVIREAAAHAPDAIVIVDAIGVIRYWNSGAERIFGYRADDMIGSTLDPVIPERLRQRHHDGFRAAMARGESHYGADDLLAVPACHAEGWTISIEFSVTLLADATGTVEHVAAIMRDVTARRAREQELRHRLAVLEEQSPEP